MKTPLLFLAAIVAFFVLPVDFTTMISVLFVAGLAAIAVCDYQRQTRAKRFRTVAALGIPANEHFRLAA